MKGGLISAFGVSWLEDQVFNKICEFKVSFDYLLRVNSLLLVIRLKDSLSEGFVNNRLIQLIIPMKDDTVPNVRINMAKCTEELGNIWSEKNIKEIIIPILKDLSNDIDFDVKHFAIKALKHKRIMSLCS